MIYANTKMLRKSFFSLAFLALIPLLLMACEHAPISSNLSELNPRDQHTLTISATTSQHDNSYA
jgi:hypothetical protein